MYKIEKNVPIPNEVMNRKPAGRKAKYPFKDLEVNDSFFVPYADYKSDQHCVKSVQEIIYITRKKTKHTYVYNKEAKGMRVWRVA